MAEHHYSSLIPTTENVSSAYDSPAYQSSLAAAALYDGGLGVDPSLQAIADANQQLSQQLTEASSSTNTQQFHASPSTHDQHFQSNGVNGLQPQASSSTKKRKASPKTNGGFDDGGDKPIRLKRACDSCSRRKVKVYSHLEKFLHEGKG